MPESSGRGGAGPNRSRSRFFRNRFRTLSLVFLLVAVAALMIGGSFAEISSNGAPTSRETSIIRLIIVASLLVAIILYVIGGRLLTDDSD